jgi:hypothetical protein
MERKKVRDSTWDGRDDEDDGRKGVQFGEDGDRGDGKRIGIGQEEKKVAVGDSSVVGMGDEAEFKEAEKLLGGDGYINARGWVWVPAQSS